MKPVALLAALPLLALATLAAAPAHAGGISLDLTILLGGHPHCPPPVVVERPVIVQRPVVVERPVIVERRICVEPAPVRVERCEPVAVVERRDRHDGERQERWHHHEEQYRVVHRGRDQRCGHE